MSLVRQVLSSFILISPRRFFLLLLRRCLSSSLVRIVARFFPPTIQWWLRMWRWLTSTRDRDDFTALALAEAPFPSCRRPSSDGQTEAQPQQMDERANLVKIPNRMSYEHLHLFKNYQFRRNEEAVTEQCIFVKCRAEIYFHHLSSQFIVYSLYSLPVLLSIRPVHHTTKILQFRLRLLFLKHCISNHPPLNLSGCCLGHHIGEKHLGYISTSTHEFG